MTQEEFITHSTNFIEENISKIKEIYFNNCSDCNQAILILENEIYYVSENQNQDLYNALSPSNKSKIEELDEYDFLIIVTIDGYFGYFNAPATNFEFENLSFLKLDGIIDNNQVYLEFTKFIFVGEEELNVDNLNINEINFNDIDAEELTEILSNVGNFIQDKIINSEISNEKLFAEIITFCYFIFRKITKSKEGYFEVKSENMYRNLTEIEKSNFIFILDTILEGVQELSKEVLSENDYDNLNLDFINMSKLIGQSEALKFDEKIIGFDHLIGKMY